MEVMMKGHIYRSNAIKCMPRMIIVVYNDDDVNDTPLLLLGSPTATAVEYASNSSVAGNMA
jgi:hypothetical protein